MDSIINNVNDCNSFRKVLDDGLLAPAAIVDEADRLR